MLDGHISTYFNKDTHDLFMLWIVLVCQLYCVLFYYCCSFILLLFDFYLSFVHLLFDFVSLEALLFHCSLFIVDEKIFNSDPGLHSRYFIPVPVVHEVPISTSSSMQVQ
jgi:hypothetical protein